MSKKSGKKGALAVAKAVVPVVGVAGAAVGAVVGGCQAVYEWGKECYATPAEQALTYPGDELMERFDPALVETVTSAITINAPVEEVYPWIYQWGGTKSGSLSSEVLERVFGRMSIFNRYEICEEWQMPDAFMPGDFMEWDRSGMGCEAADVVADKYILSFSDIKHPPRARGAYAIAGGTVDDMNFIWGWYFVPLRGNRTRFICHWKYYGTTNAPTRFALKRAILQCGTAMQRWQMEYTKKCAEGTMPVHNHVKLYRKIFGPYHHVPDEIQDMQSKKCVPPRWPIRLGRPSTVRGMSITTITRSAFRAPSRRSSRWLPSSKRPPMPRLPRSRKNSQRFSNT